MSHEHEIDVDHHVKVYMIVFGSLLFLTLITVAAYLWLHLSPGLTIAVALLIAAVKGSLVACYFMHLIDEKKLIYSIMAVAVLFFFFVLLVPFATESNPIVM